MRDSLGTGEVFLDTELFEAVKALLADDLEVIGHSVA